MAEKWDDIFNAAKAQPKAEETHVADSSQAKAPQSKGKAKPSRSSKLESVESPWSDLEPEEKEPTVRLNVDIPMSLNDLLAEKARRLRKPKTELVRHLLKWALDESNE